MKKVAVIGGGPAGMTAAAAASKNGHFVTLIEKNEKLGKKLYITGKGRCNLTNDSDEEEFLKNVAGNPYFLYSAIYTYNARYVMDYFESLCVPLTVERGSRVFPKSGKASDITKALIKDLNNSGVNVLLNTKAKGLSLDKGSSKLNGVFTDKGFIEADAVIVAAGGLSYPVTGSTGDGYKFALEAGHKVTDTFPSLVSLKSDEAFIKDLAGLSLKNIGLNIISKGKAVYRDFGEILFTHDGLSGPVILSASRYVSGKRGMDKSAVIDLKPALTADKLDKRILEDFGEAKNKAFKNSLDKLLPQKLIPVIIKLSAIDPDKKVNLITKAERLALVNILKNFTIRISGTGGYDEAVITSGGVSADGINPSTMESKIIKGLYFAGEVIDVDAFTGGFNLQIAFSTGFLAGNSV